MSTNLCSFTFVVFFGAQTITSNNKQHRNPSTTNQGANKKEKKSEKHFLPIKYLKECNTLTPIV